MKLNSRLKQIFQSPFDHNVARSLYVSIVTQARTPAFYELWGVPDTPEGRYDMVALHTYLMIKHVQADPSITDDLSQAIFDIMFADMDQNLREMSIGDTGVAKRIKKMAEGFYGRAEAYDNALVLDDGDATLKDVINRNVYRNAQSTEKNLAGMAAYIRRELENLNSHSANSVLNGEVAFGPVHRV